MLSKIQVRGKRDTPDVKQILLVSSDEGDVTTGSGFLHELHWETLQVYSGLTFDLGLSGGYLSVLSEGLPALRFSESLTF